MIEIRHVGISVLNMEKAIDFFQILGFETVSSHFEKGQFIKTISKLPMDSTVHIVKMISGNSAIELLSYNPIHFCSTNMKELYNAGTMHIAFTVKDICSMQTKLESIGTEFHCDPHPTPNGKALVTFCEGPKRIKIELIQILEEE